MHLPEPSLFVEHRLCLREPTVDKFRMVPFIIKQTNKLIWSCLQGQGTNKLSSHVWSRNGFIEYLMYIYIHIYIYIHLDLLVECILSRAGQAAVAQARVRPELKPA